MATRTLTGVTRQLLVSFSDRFSTMDGLLVISGRAEEQLTKLNSFPLPPRHLTINLLDSTIPDHATPQGQGQRETGYETPPVQPIANQFTALSIPAHAVQRGEIHLENRNPILHPAVSQFTGRDIAPPKQSHVQAGNFGSLRQPGAAVSCSAGTLCPPPHH